MGNDLFYYDSIYITGILACQLAVAIISIMYVQKKYLSGKIVYSIIVVPLLISIYLLPSGKILLLAIRGINTGISLVFDSRTFFEIVSTLSLQAILISIYLIINYKSDIKALRTKKEELRKLEAGFLESQLDNHFLFNSLNSIYGLAVSGSEKTAKSILLLSDILSFILYDTRKGIYSVEKELEIMNKYINLQQIRFSNKLRIDIQVRGDLSRCYIRPLILFSLLENSIKHSAIDSDRYRRISIRMESEITDLHFYIENRCRKKENSDHSGIGMQNMKQRLRLLYPDAHSFTAIRNDTTFRVRLSLFTHQ
jgi:LytS/YehU family sensor histidine kinase